MERVLLNEGLRAGIINYYNKLEIDDNNLEITKDYYPEKPFPFPESAGLSSKELFGKRVGTQRNIVNIGRH